MIEDPLYQFTIKQLAGIRIFGLEIILTNSAFAMLIAVSLAGLFFIFALSSNGVTRIRVAAEMLYAMIAQMLSGTAGESAKKYTSLIFTLFLFILMCNLLGIVPLNFTATSHIAITFAMAITVFIGVTLLGFIKHGVHYLSLFLPKGVPMIMAPLFIIIELFAYLARPVSLSIRLAANMTAGHIVLKIVAAFVVVMGFFGILPLALLTILTGFEIFVAILQAYIFSMLTCVYLSDALNLH